MHEAIQAILDWLEQLGLWGIFFGLVIEVIPSEIVLAYGGYLVSKGSIPFWSAVWFGVVGGTIAQIIMYGIGKFGGRPFLERYGKYLLVKKEHLDLSEKWFERYGTGVVFTARFIPVVRHAISIPAGIAGMPLVRFTLLTALAVLPWSVGFIWLGMTLGGNWRSIDEVARQYTLPIVAAAVVLTAAYIIYVRRKNGGGESEDLKAAKPEPNAPEPNISEPDTPVLGSDYIVHSALTLQSGSRSERFELVAIGPNGVFFVPAAGVSVERLEFMLRKLVRAANIPAAVVSVRSEHPPAAIRKHTARHHLDQDSIRTLADMIARHSTQV